MASLKNGGKSASDLDLTVLPPPKRVTSSTQRQARESAIESKRSLLLASASTETFVIETGTEEIGKVRNLSSEEIGRLRATKQQVASRLRVKHPDGDKV